MWPCSLALLKNFWHKYHVNRFPQTPEVVNDKLLDQSPSQIEATMFHDLRGNYEFLSS
jgi:hypothetical protein